MQQYVKIMQVLGLHMINIRDAFIPPKPFASWVLNEATCQWEAPTPMPTDDKRYTWNEETLSWDELI
jgi:hypothetical protein